MINSKESLIACSKCKLKVPLNDLKADKEGKKWVCTACYSLQHPLNLEKSRIPERNFNNIKLEESNKKFKYQRTACKYSFSRNNEFKGVCPYCSKLGSIEKAVI